MRNKNIAPVGNKLKKNLTGPKKEKFIKIYRVSNGKPTSNIGRCNPQGPPRNPSVRLNIFRRKPLKKNQPAPMS